MPTRQNLSHNFPVLFPLYFILYTFSSFFLSISLWLFPSSAIHLLFHSLTHLLAHSLTSHTHSILNIYFFLCIFWSFFPFQNVFFSVWFCFSFFLNSSVKKFLLKDFFYFIHCRIFIIWLHSHTLNLNAISQRCERISKKVEISVCVCVCGKICNKNLSVCIPKKKHPISI